MGASAGKPPAAPDPSTVLALQNQYNRSNTSGPFGSQQWSTGGPGGHETLTTSLSPQMQGVVDRAFSAAETPYQKEYVPQGVDQLASALLGRVGSRYGLSGSGLNTNLQQQKPASGMSPQAPQGMGGGMSGMGINMQQPPGMGAAQLMQQPGATSSALGSLMGAPGGGFGGASPLSAMGALQGQNSPMGMPNVAMQQPGGQQQPITRGF